MCDYLGRHIEDCNGATPVSLKTGLDLPLPPQGQPESSLWIESKTQNRTTPDYAEVQQRTTVSSFQSVDGNSPAAYATTTLVPSMQNGDRGVRNN